MGAAIQMPRRPEWVDSFTDEMIRGAELMAEGDKTQKEIAKELNITEQTISRRWKHNQLWMQYVNYLSTLNTLESALKIKGLTSKAVEKLSKLLDSENEFIQIRAVQEILNRAGVKDLEFDLLPKSEKKLDMDSVRARFKSILEAETADEEIIDITDYASFAHAPTNDTQMPDDLGSENERDADGENSNVVNFEDYVEVGEDDEEGKTD